MTPKPLYCWKSETLSFFHVSLILGVNMDSLLSKSCQNYGIVSKAPIVGKLQIH